MSHSELLNSVGLAPNVDRSEWMLETVEAEAYYSLLENATAQEDFGLPFRYANAVHVDDYGALGLGLKTATTLRDALSRLVRYILVLSDTLEYELRPEPGGIRYVLSRPSHRRGAWLANECAMGAVVSSLRQITDSAVTPDAVSFRHGEPEKVDSHRSFFGCPVRFGRRINALHFSDRTLDIRTRLADEGLSAFILATLDDLKGERADRTLHEMVYSAITDSLPDGKPSKAQIARRLGMSERTLHRRLAEQGRTFKSIAIQAQRDAAEALLSTQDHSLAEVAFLTGFSDQSAFSRAFKGWTGETPLRFRDSIAT